MKSDQMFTPKYWVLHNKSEDDVYLQTASKTYDDCCTFADAMCGEEWWDNDNLEVILVEIRMLVFTP